MYLSKKRIAQFWARVDKSGDCWLFDKVSKRQGYGFFSILGGQVGAHRIAWELTHGPIAKGMHIDHLCRVRACVNPSHLQPVSQHVNMARGKGASALNAEKTYCKVGHPFTQENTLYRGKDMARCCRICKRTQEAKAYALKVELDKQQGVYQGANKDKTHCPHGHPYDAANTLWAARGAGRVQRVCRACQRNHAAKARAKAKKWF